MAVCKTNDDFTKEILKWVIELSNGETIYQDDDRPGEIERCAWYRLRDYVKENNLSIVSFKIQFFTHIEDCTVPNALGYYFTQAVSAIAFSGPNSYTWRYYLVGSLMEDNNIYIQRWLVPEIILVGNEIRSRIIDQDDPKLILNN